jgi:hypothetical protein
MDCETKGDNKPTGECSPNQLKAVNEQRKIHFTIKSGFTTYFRHHLSEKDFQVAVTSLLRNLKAADTFMVHLKKRLFEPSISKAKRTRP